MTALLTTVLMFLSPIFYPLTAVPERSGYTLTVLHKADGRWRLARDANLLTMKSPSDRSGRTP